MDYGVIITWMEISPLSDWLKPWLGKKYNAIATSDDIIDFILP